MDYHSMSLDIAQLISDLNFEYVDVLGHSMGGKTAMTFALTNVCKSAFHHLQMQLWLSSSINMQIS